VTTTDFSCRDIVKVLRTHGYTLTGRTGSHVQLRDMTDDGSVRTVTVPLHDRISIGTLRDISDQCGANDFEKWCEWVDDHR
jgi:predicted RNA binding protein YcfA (HicA-like mRNA interferase family)